MKKLNITKKQFGESKYFTNKYGTLKYVSESGNLYKTSKGKIIKFVNESSMSDENGTIRLQFNYNTWSTPTNYTEAESDEDIKNIIQSDIKKVIFNGVNHSRQHERRLSLSIPFISGTNIPQNVNVTFSDNCKFINDVDEVYCEGLISVEVIW